MADSDGARSRQRVNHWCSLLVEDPSASAPSVDVSPFEVCLLWIGHCAWSSPLCQPRSNNVQVHLQPSG